MIRCLATKCANQAQAGPFCEVHATASPSRRGGWVAVSKRRPYDATLIAPRLWLGGVPPFDVDLPRIDTLALCARELQPDSIAFHGNVLRCPIPDAELDSDQIKAASMVAVSVAKAIVAGRRALVTCHMGLNRSALVVALTLHQLTTMSAERVVAHIRRRRGPAALSNTSFLAVIDRIIGDGRPRVRRRANDTIA